jgi:hypothetical protein
MTFLRHVQAKKEKKRNDQLEARWDGMMDIGCTSLSLSLHFILSTRQGSTENET